TGVMGPVPVSGCGLQVTCQQVGVLRLEEIEELFHIPADEADIVLDHPEMCRVRMGRARKIQPIVSAPPREVRWAEQVKATAGRLRQADLVHGSGDGSVP